jgi:iron-sulfur cluster repair protein YtfE (RIC family)
MTIIEQLNDDHHFFREMFEEMEILASSPAQEESVLRASELVQIFRHRHRIHLHRESSVLFPALLGYLQTDQTHLTRSEIFHHLQEEHMGVGRNIYALEQDIVSRPLSAKWLRSFRELADTFVPHMKREEEHVFPEASRLMPEKQLETMAYSEFFPAF